MILAYITLVVSPSRAPVLMPSPHVTQLSFSLIWQIPKLPMAALFSGMATRSVARITCNLSGSTSATKMGARCSKTCSLSPQGRL